MHLTLYRVKLSLKNWIFIANSLHIQNMKSCVHIHAHTPGAAQVGPASQASLNIFIELRVRVGHTVANGIGVSTWRILFNGRH